MNRIISAFNTFLNALVQRGLAWALIFGFLPALFIAYAGYTLILSSNLGEIQLLTGKVTTLETEVARGKSVEASEPEFRAEFGKVVELFYDSLPLLPTTAELANVLANVQASATQNNVTLTGLTAIKEAQKTPNADKLYEREMPATVTGKYDDVLRFLMDVSRKTRILIVRDYAISSVTEKSERSSARPLYVSVQFSLLAFHAPPTKEFPTLPPGIEVPQPILTTTTRQSVNQEK